MPSSTNRSRSETGFHLSTRFASVQSNLETRAQEARSRKLGNELSGLAAIALAAHFMISEAIQLEINWRWMRMSRRESARSASTY